MLEGGAGCACGGAWHTHTEGRPAGWGLTLGRLAAWLRSVEEAGASRRLWALPPLWRSKLGLHSQEGQAAKKGRRLLWRCNKGCGVSC